MNKFSNFKIHWCIYSNCLLCNYQYTSENQPRH